MYARSLDQMRSDLGRFVPNPSHVHAVGDTVYDALQMQTFHCPINITSYCRQNKPDTKPPILNFMNAESTTAKDYCQDRQTADLIFASIAHR